MRPCSKADLSAIADEVGVGVFQELDYLKEAANMDEFNRRHKWLGFVRAPRWVPQYTGPPGRARVLTTEWIQARGLLNNDWNPGECCSCGREDLVCGG